MSLFGNQAGGAPASNLFGGGSGQPSLFGGGGNAAPAGAGAGAGQPFQSPSATNNAQKTGLFGAPAPAQGKSLFGGNPPADAGSGGMPAPSVNINLFGGAQNTENKPPGQQPAPAASSLFGAGGGVSNQPAPATTNSIFGNNKPAEPAKQSAIGGAFGSSQASQQQPATSSSLFGGQQNKEQAKPSDQTQTQQPGLQLGGSSKPAEPAKASLFGGQAPAAASQQDAQAKPQTSMFSSTAPPKPAADGQEEKKESKPATSNLFGGAGGQSGTTDQKKPEESKSSIFGGSQTTANNTAAAATTDPKKDLFGVQTEKKTENQGLNANGEQKQESKEGKSGNPVGENVAPVAEVKKSEDQQLKEAFMGKMFDEVSQKWITTVNANEKQFNKSVEQLQEYEWLLIKQMSEIERLETQQKQVTHAYNSSFDEVSCITSQQNNLLNELSTIEEELDKFLQSHAYSAKKASQITQQQVATMMHSSTDLKQMPTKDRIFQQAADLDQQIQTVSQNLDSCVQKISSADNDYAETAKKYLGQSADATKVENVEMVEKSLAMFYESMKWIENSGIDIQYQLDKVQATLNSHM